MTTVHQIMAEPSVYKMTINGTVVTFAEEEVTSQTKFRNRIYHALPVGRLPNQVEKKEFENLVTAIAAVKQRVDPGKEDTNSGAVQVYLAEYLSSKAREEDGWTRSATNNRLRKVIGTTSR